MDIRTSDEYYHLIYDPLLHGYTTSFFKTKTGSPAISTNVLRLASAAFYTTGQFMYGEYAFKVNVPTVANASLVCGAAGSTDITVWDQITDGEFAVTLDGVAYNVTGIDFSTGAYTPAFLTGKSTATATIDTWSAVTSGGFKITIDGTARAITGINFKTAFPYTSAYLTGGNAATSTIATWAAVSDGSFRVTMDGTQRDVTGIDFRNVAAYTPAFLTGGTSATSDFATWATVTDGSFDITINGAAKSITSIDFTGVLSMADVAAVIQAKLRTATGTNETVVWSTNKFIITSGVTTSASAITVLSATGSGTDISGAGATAYMDSDVGAGDEAVTNKVSLMTMAQVATTIQTALRAVTSALETVVWSTNHFVVSSVNTTVDSAITVLSAVGSGTDISGAGATTFMDAEIAVGAVTAHATTKTMADVATLIQTAIRTATSKLETVTWEGTNHFLISSVNTTSISAITVASAPDANTDLSGAGGTTFMDCDTGNGTVTARAMADSMDYVASQIQTVIVALTGESDTVVYDTDHFVLRSDTTGGVSSVSVLSAVDGGSGTDISGAGFLNGLTGTGSVVIGSSKNFGLKLPCMGATNYILFQVIGDRLVCKTCDAAGGIEYYSTPFLSAWMGVDTVYSFVWAIDSIVFSVNGVRIAKLADHVVKDVPLSIIGENLNADNTDFGYIYFKGVRKTNSQFTHTFTVTA